VEFDFPPLDCHAHIDPTVTRAQVATLGGAQVFAMNRTLGEWVEANGNQHNGIFWGPGAYPGLKRAQDLWRPTVFDEALEHTFLVGEVGLDSGRALGPQVPILEHVLSAARAHLVSVHSSGRVAETLDIVERTRARGVILHWFTGEAEEIRRAEALGCYFSVNAAMSDEQLKALPYGRVLPETDYPSARGRTQARKPGDIRELERRVARLTQTNNGAVRRHWYEVLGRAMRHANAEALVPDGLGTLLDRARSQSK
jgi:TatD DNase family protein